LTNTYDSNGRVATQTQADSGVFEFDYTLDGSGKVTQTDVTDPRGYVQRYTFNSCEYHLSVTEALGTVLERSTTLERASPSHRITSITDPLERETTYACDSHGNVTSVTRLAGTADAVTTTLTYEPAYQQVASVTDPLSHTTTYTYDYQDHLTTISDPLSHQTTFTYNPSGQPLTMTNAANERDHLPDEYVRQQRPGRHADAGRLRRLRVRLHARWVGQGHAERRDRSARVRAAVHVQQRRVPPDSDGGTGDCTGAHDDARTREPEPPDHQPHGSLGS
jgi:YD repeat-containing protein